MPSGGVEGTRQASTSVFLFDSQPTPARIYCFLQIVLSSLQPTHIGLIIEQFMLQIHRKDETLEVYCQTLER